ncbi:MAG: Asp-tRNA(Asn)/Glu-tRNA(Gln) amidotransferase subunit GatC [Oscillospiraceae bacterium]|nr:Asp-tRNA(Asn)/Glu-tRNA(Gln) amidotransferase subunit GatC [Oscillospiraceae bacterium]
MQIDDKLITYLEDLSCLTLSESEKRRLSADLEKILDGMKILESLDTENTRELSHPFDNLNAFREDIEGVSFERELILKNAPSADDRMFIAPKTVE